LKLELELECARAGAVQKYRIKRGDIQIHHHKWKKYFYQDHGSTISNSNEMMQRTSGRERDTHRRYKRKQQGQLNEGGL